ncbi:MAG: lipase maturation factor family protein [Undibacterium sp.]|nr:lipase maturation factor family protein [Opitutaceae bacterium]
MRSARSSPAPSHLSSLLKPGYGLWLTVREFSGFAANATYLWPRWLVLRAVGFVFLFVFSGIIVESRALIGPDGIVPLDEFFRQLRGLFPGAADALISAPTLFWLSTAPAFITTLAWGGLVAAAALCLNLWPRLALAACWLFFLSFASTWRVFSPAQLDNLMLEVALLCLPFAPAGFRPGLGATSPPRPLALFMVRWLLFRVMFESGVVKLVAGDPHWRDLTAMEVMYETSPFPTLLGYWDHHLPHVYHLFEIALTFAAELAAPLLAVFGGRRGRWIALLTWTVFQIGIQLTSNFGWLNTASLGLGLLLLDDQMLASVTTRLKPSGLSARLTLPICPPVSAPSRAWRSRVLGLALWTHFALSIVFLAKACGLPLPAALTAPVRLVSEFRSVNEYSLYATFVPDRFQVEFEGSNDAGRTWRTFDYRYLPQHPDQITPFIAPWFARFEATLQIAAWNGRKSPVVPVVASHLLTRNPDVMRLFRTDPFPDRPPTIIRMRGYRLTFTDLDTYRRTGRFWHKELVGDYLPALWQNERGEIAEFSLAPADTALRSGNFSAALSFLEQQFALGNLDAGLRLADFYARGLGLRPDPAKAFALFSDLASRGELSAIHNLATCHEYGIGTPSDLARAATLYRTAADLGYTLSYYNLGAMHALQKITPPDDVRGLALLLRARSRSRGDDPIARFILEDRSGHRQRLLDRMTPAAIALAHEQATRRP